jgi:Domain of unknown function (DUF4331)
MKFARSLAGVFAVVALVAVIVLYSRTPARSFDIQNSPAVVNNPSADILDTYMFPSPTNINNVVVAMDVVPLIPAGQGLKTFFNQSVLYTMKFDNQYAAEAINSRPSEDLVIQISVGPPTNGTQQIFVYGPAVAARKGATTTLVDGGAFSGTGFINRPFSSVDGLSVFAGARQDPFFFDLQQFYNIFPNRNMGSTAASCLPAPVGLDTCPQGFNNPGVDEFADTNVLSIVIELPRAALQVGQNGSIVAFWATTSTSTGS